METITIKISTELIGDEPVKLEDKLRDFFEENGITACIDNSDTGNTTHTRSKQERIRRK